MLTHVLQPARIGRLEVKNRVLRSAHVTGLGAMTDDLIAYHVARGRGGVGLSVIETLSVHPSSPTFLNVSDPELPGRYAKLVEAVRPTGMRLFQQLWHGGHNGAPFDGSPPWGPCDRPGLSGVPSIRMSKAMIDAVVAGFAEAAAKCAAWGIDGVEIHCAHGYLLAQFLSANTNVREDDYGGNFENRARFPLEVLRAVRAAVPDAYPVGVRLAPDLNEGGVGPAESVRLAQMMEADALIDFADVSIGNYQTLAALIGGMHEPVGYQLPTSVPITTQLKCATMVIGRFRTLEEADQVIRAGEADFVGLTRAHIADPDLVRKTLAGETERVRPCIGCNQGCIGNMLGPRMRMGCVVNPGAGFELSVGDDRLTPAADPKRVLVIGGGPAGLEAARVAALRGHQVMLAEAAPELGGALRFATRAPTRHGMGDFLTWLEAEIYRLGVEVRLSTYMEEEDVVALTPDAVIVATGSMPRVDGIQASNPGEPVRGMERATVISSHDLFGRGKHDWGKSAVVVDDTGHYEGVASAEYLVSQGLTVTYVTRHISFAPGVEPALMVEPALKRLSRGAFDVKLRTRAIAVEEGQVLVGPTYLPTTVHESVPADVVVFVSPNRPNRDLFDALAERVPILHVVGDAKSPRYLEAAVRDGHLAAAELD